MSTKQAITYYYNNLNQLLRLGVDTELSLRRAFANLLDDYCRPQKLTLVDEHAIKHSPKRPDGTVRDDLRLDWGHWESKRPGVNLDEEITKKFALGYPQFNIIFENTQEIILIQQGQERLCGPMEDSRFLDKVLSTFVNYERPEIHDFRQAIENFKQDIPQVIEALRAMIATQATNNPRFQQAQSTFWQLCRDCINPDISAFDIREMLIQHILTAEIFDTIFDNSHFHRENNIAQQLEMVINTFFTHALRQNTLSKIDNYYRIIKAEAARIDSYHEKQKFLKVIYENFYKAYNPKGADRLGIVYTPSEIVRFMIESTDALLEKHFNCALADKGVEILDPATGTGTFITDLIEHIPAQYLEYKYQHEIHANEMAILPYYIASLNIEYTYQQKMGTYVPFENIVFVDTLDNLGFKFAGKQEAFEGFGLSAENLARIKSQNERHISVVIGNPPYNAKQEWYNDFNPNQKYQKIDEQIRESYVKHGTAQNKNQLYDMYFRFFRWASNRLNDEGILCFITNHSYIHAQAFDGFRKSIAQEFDYAYIIDLGGDIRNRKDSHVPTGNVFDIITGVAIGFFVKLKKRRNETCIVSYLKISDDLTKEEKLEFLSANRFDDLVFSKIREPQQRFWLNITDNDFDSLLPLMNKTVKACHSEQAVFKLFSIGVKTQRDSWVHDFSATALAQKISYFVQVYQNTLADENFADRNSIKWDRELTKYLGRRIEKQFEADKIIPCMYRPFVKKYFYYDRHFNGMTYQWPKIPPENNFVIGFISGITKSFSVLASKYPLDGNAISPAAGGTQCLPLYRYDRAGDRRDNITDWTLARFRAQYAASQSKIKNPQSKIEKLDIFHYVYAVLHDPAYRQKYEINLKREFPRIPFYEDFWQWAEWGRQLLELHVNFETVEPWDFGFSILDFGLEDNLKSKIENPKSKLRADKIANTIEIDSATTLTGVPALAWEYKLGNRSALEWVLDRYKEKTPSDPTIAERFNSYRFADYKEQVIELLARVCTVSVETMRIVGEMG